MSGISLGSSIFPPFIRFLLDEYGLRGSMIILTGITMNMFVGASLYRPLSLYRKLQKKRKPLKTDAVSEVKKPVKLEMKDIGKINPEKFLSVDSVASDILGRSPVDGYAMLGRDDTDSPRIV